MNKLEELRNANNKHEFAVILGIETRFLNYVLYSGKDEPRYSVFEIPKKSGGFRRIYSPNEHLKSIQILLANLLMDCKDIINDPKKKNTLSHGFERRKSIITNASLHLKRKYVLNFDIEDFFDAFNFGRVRGFFIKNKNFELNKDVATIIAQIACHNNVLPQGSPCSPVISNLITNILDIRLKKFVQKYGCSYSRYVDDITISTRKKIFPEPIAKLDEYGDFVLGVELKKELERAGFSINNKKTRIQNSGSRQDVTNIVVNQKIGTKHEYWRTARAMAHSLFTKGSYFINGIECNKLEILEGKLQFIDCIDKYNNSLHKSSTSSNTDKGNLWNYFKVLNKREKTYSKFLYYKSFHANCRPIILTEGKTDIIYLKSALKILKERYPLLARSNSVSFGVSFFYKNKRTKHLLDLDDGSICIKRFVNRYEENYKKYLAKEALAPVIMILDNDSGQNLLIKDIAKGKNITGESIKTNNSFIHICHNLYLILTPLKDNKDTAMESLFTDDVLETEIDGKKFNSENDRCNEDQYGKMRFATRVIRPNARKISFNGFIPIFDAVVNAINDYNERIKTDSI